MKSRKSAFVLAGKVAGIAAGNFALFGWSIFHDRRNHQWYKSLPVEQQEKLYNGCILQKVGTDYSIYSTLTEIVHTQNPKSHEHIKPIKPFKPS